MQLAMVYLAFEHVPHPDSAPPTRRTTATTVGGVTWTSSGIEGTTAAWATTGASSSSGGGGGGGDVNALMRDARASSLAAEQLLAQLDSYKARYDTRCT